MTYQVYAQRNVPGLPAVPWASQRLGTCDGITLASDGCYTTAEAQVATHYEHPINPGQLDDLKTNKGLYVNGCQSVDGWLSRLFPDIVYVESKFWSAAADLNYLAMAADEEIIIGLDTHNRGAVVSHFARVFDYNPKTGVLRIDDPWWGVTEDFAYRWGSPARNVMKAIKYRVPGWVPPWNRVPAPLPPPPPPPIVIVPSPDLAQQVAALTAENADLKAKLAQSATVVDQLTAKFNLDEAAIAFAVLALQQRKGA